MPIGLAAGVAGAAGEEPPVEKPRPYIGGQAVLEGVMMRAPSSLAIVVRRRDGSLHIRERAMQSEAVGARKIPFVRGAISLVDALKLGQEALRFSAEQMEKDLEAEEREEAARKRAPKGPAAMGILSVATTAVTRAAIALGLGLFQVVTTDGAPVPSVPPPSATPPSAPPPSGRPSSAPHPAGATTKKPSGGGMWFSVLLMVGFMWALPQASAAGLNRLLHLDLEVQSAPFQAITGFFKLALVVGYLLAIRRMGPIRRVFQYHGAEHKTISTYEAKEELTVANARAKTTLHPRCGTTFLVMVAIVSILVFTAVGGVLPRIHTGQAVLDNLVFFLVKIPFIPVIAAATFEIQRVFARHCTTGPLRALLWPGFLVQKITTIEPDDDQLEVALGSLRATLFREGGETSTSHGDVRFATYVDLSRADRLRRA